MATDPGPNEGDAGLGPDDGITRKDFLDGVAITAAGLMAAAAAPYLTGAEAAAAAVGTNASGVTIPHGYYPPTSTGSTGEQDGVGSRMGVTRARAERPRD